MKQLFCFLFILLQVFISVKANGYYTIVAPGSIQSNSDYHVTVTLHDNPEPSTIKVAISGPSYNVTKNIEVEPFSSKIAHFEVPPLEDGTYELQTEGMNGLIFKRYTKLVLKNELPRIYIQIDKALYKPGESVQYRILALDINSGPAKVNEPLNLVFYDSAQNRIKVIKDIKFMRGVHSGKFQLSEEPVLGNWVMQVISAKKEESPGVPTAKARKTFEVDKYVLPKFTVEIESDKKVAILDRVFKITVRSKYTHGQPVKGNATITAHLTSYGGDILPRAQKTLDINGKAEVEFDIMDDLGMNRYMPNIKVLAIVTEGHTGLQQNTSTIIDVDHSRYTIAVPTMSYRYEANKQFEIKAFIKKLNGSPVTDAKSTAKLILSNRETYDMTNVLIFETDVDKSGVALFKLNLTYPDNYRSVRIIFEEKIERLSAFSIEAVNKTEGNNLEMQRFAGSYQSYPSPPREGFGSEQASERVGPLKLHEAPDSKPSEEIVVNVQSDDVIPYFFYTIMSRGRIIKHDFVKVGDEKKYYKLKIQPTFEMSPNAKLFVYLIDDGDMKSDEITLSIPNKAQNKLQITGPEVVKSNDLVTLNIKTDPDSFVGLMAVDQSVLLLKSGNDLDEHRIFDDLGHLYSLAPSDNGRHNTYPGKRSGFVTLTNACYPRFREETARVAYMDFQPREAALMQHYAMPGSIMGYSAAPQPPPPSPVEVQPIIRKNFVETWIFDDIERTDSNGMANFSKTIPDTMTSWVVTGFSLNEKTGFAMSENPTNIRVFQPFFISLNLPYSVKRGEVIAIPIAVFNYMSSEVEAEVTMDNTDEEYSFTEAFTDVEETVLSDNQVTRRVKVPSNSGAAVSFMIYPRVVGEITLKIKAVTPLAGDSIHQKLRVELEGVTQYKNEALFVSIPPQGEAIKHIFKADIPPDVVVESEFLEFIAVSDLLGPTIRNIEGLVRMPYGGGSQQNMMNFVPNILVLNYLEATKKDNPALVEKAKNYMMAGYQRQLTYRLYNGAFSAFGRHSPADNWLTAFVTRSFIQARKYISIDEMVIEKALDYLVAIQNREGAFDYDRGYFYHSDISSYILLAFLEDETYALKYKYPIANAVEYLARNVGRDDNLQSLALTALVFQKVNHPALPKLLERLELKSYNENNLKWWSSSSKYDHNDIEITSYILQTLLETKEADVTKLLPIIKWLVKQRNSLGGFASTQNTVVALQAFIKFAEKYVAAGRGEIHIEFEAQDGVGKQESSGSFKIDKKDGLDLIGHKFPRHIRQLSVTAKGEGTALLQFSYHYNMAAQDDNSTSGFLLKHTPHKVPSLDHMSMNICAEYKPQLDDEIKESNMAIMEVFLPSGFKTDDDSLAPIRNIAQVQRVETIKDATVIIVYFDSLVAGKPICIDVYGEKYHRVAKLKPSPITIYDYYNTRQRTTIFYEVKSSLCDICEKEQCGKGCNKR